MPYGVLYDPKSNGVVRLAASAARFIMDKQRQQRARSLPAEEGKHWNPSCGRHFTTTSTPFYSEHPHIWTRGNSTNWKSCSRTAATCAAGTASPRVEPMDSKPSVSLRSKADASSGFWPNRAFIKYPKLPFWAGNPLHFQTQWKPFVTNVPDSLRAVECRKPQNFLSLRIAFQFLKMHGGAPSLSVHVTISIDGPAEINDQLRVFPNGYKTHDLVLRNIQKLRAHGIEPAMVEATYTAVHEKSRTVREETVAALQEELGNLWHLSMRLRL